MKYQDKNLDPDWVKEVPNARFHGPYEDYGWEPGESLLPEFRDPSVRLTPEERRQLQRELRQNHQRRPRRRVPVQGETHRYGQREVPDDERGSDYGWSQYYGEPFPRGYNGESYYGEREAWMSQGPHTGKGPKGYQRSDERIREDVYQRLTAHGQIDARAISVEVHDGEVTLRGPVDSRRTKRMAEDTVDSISGVRDVHNDLTIQPAAEKPGRFLESR